MTLAERIAARLSGLQTDRYMFGLFGDDRMGKGGFGKLQILGKTKHVTRCQNCGRAGLKHAVVCAVVGDDGHPTNQYYYFGSDCAAKLAGKAEKDVEAEAEHQESSGRPRMKSIKSPKPNEGQMELSLRFAAAWQAHVERMAGSGESESVDKYAQPPGKPSWLASFVPSAAKAAAPANATGIPKPPPPPPIKPPKPIAPAATAQAAEPVKASHKGGGLHPTGSGIQGSRAKDFADQIDFLHEAGVPAEHRVYFGGKDIEALSKHGITDAAEYQRLGNRGDGRNPGYGRAMAHKHSKPTNSLRHSDDSDFVHTDSGHVLVKGIDPSGRSTYIAEIPPEKVGELKPKLISAFNSRRARKKDLFQALYEAVTERYGRVKPTKGQAAFDFDALSSAPQATPSLGIGSASVTSEPPALPSKGKQMGLFDQPQATAPAAKPASDWDEKKHPRWDAGDKQHHGGQFSPKQAEKAESIAQLAEQPAQSSEPQGKEERPAEPAPASESRGSGEPAAPATVGERVAAAIAKKSMDFGRKVEVRKDRAKKLGPRAKTEEPAEQVEGWAKRYAIARIDYSRDKSEEGKYAIYDTRTKSRYTGMGHRQATSKLFESEAEAKAALPLLEVARNHGVYRSQDGNSYEIRRKFDRHSALVKGGFGSRDEAELHMATNPREVINHKFPSYETYQYLTEVKREGPERRSGNVNERDFQEAFNPGGAVFGNWMSNKDGVAAFHHAHDSLHDLADVLEIHPQQVSLDGDLVYGFGAAGSGGKNAARAHYEPEQRLINLTKMSGAGSLAHEWWHALDHFIAKHHGLDGHTAVGRKARHMTGDEGLKKAITDLHHALHNTAEDRVIEAHDKVQDEKEAKRLQFRAESRQKAIEDNHRIPYTESVQDHLHNIKFDRDRLAEWKKKKVKPELLKEYDELEAKIAAGDHGEEVYVPSKSKWGLGTTTFANIKALDEVHKKITGRSFLANKDNGNDIYHQFKIDKAKAQEKAQRAAKAGQTERVFRPSTFSREAAELDRSRASSYYTLPEEMGARAFEAYIADKLNEKGIRSDYLIGKGKTNNAVYRAFGVPGPFPEGEERKQINEAFDKLLTEVRKHLRKPEREKHSLADEARDLGERVRRLVERYSAGHGFEELLARAAKYTQKGQGYNRNIHTSANRVESMLAQGRHKEAAHWADELKLRLDGLEPKPSAEPEKQNSLLDSQGQGLLFSRTGQTQRGLFGDDYEAKPLEKQESYLPKPPEPIKQHKPKPGQQSLFSAVADAMGVSVERYGSTIRHGKYSVTKGDDGLWYHFLHGKNGLQYASLVGFNSVKEAMRDAVKRAKPPAMRQVAEGPAKGNWEIVPNHPEDKGLPSQPSNLASKPQEPKDKSMFSAVADALGASVERYAAKGLMAGAAGPTQAKPKVTKIASHADLPPIPEGMTRATHFFRDANLAQQFNSGSHFKYGRGLLSSTTDAFSSNEHVHGLMKTGMNGAFDRKSFGNFVAVMDIPHQEYKSRGRMHAETPEIHNSKITGYYNRESGEFHHNPGYNPSLIKQNIGPIPSRNLTNRPLPPPISSQPAPQLNDEKASSSSPAIDVWSASYHSSVERYAAKQAASPWFLKSRELLKQKMGQHAPASQVLAMLKNNQISPEELEWTGLENHLRSKGNSPVSQEELHDLIGKFGVEESVLGGEVTREKLSKSHRKALQAIENASMVEWNPNDYTLGEYLLNMDRVLRRDAQNGDNSVLPPLNAVKMLKKAHGESRWGKYASHSLPGGENYQEMLLKLPESKNGIEDWYKTVFVPETKEENPGYEPPSTFAGYDANAKEDLTEMYQRWAKGKGSAGYLSRHWDDPNVLAHIRYKDYVGPDGKKHLHIDEIQSDWHQAGRKDGYDIAMTPERQAEYDRLFNELSQARKFHSEDVDFMEKQFRKGLADDVIHQMVKQRQATPERQALAQKERELSEQIKAYYPKEHAVPNAPFKKNWHMLAMKRMLHHAAANGYDRVTWTPGEEHADRNRLDKHLDSIHYYPNTGDLFANGKYNNSTVLTGEVKDGKFHSAHHPEMHGKHLHEIFGHDIADKIQNSKWPWSGGEHHDYKVVLKGDDLKIGQSGMRKFYDQMLPADTNKLIKRHGGKVGQFDLHLPSRVDDGDFEFTPRRTIKVHGFDITPSMKAEAASGKGQSMFSVYEEPGLHIERYEQETPGLQPRFRMGAGEQRLSEQFVKIPSTKPPAIFAILGKAAGMVGKAAVGMKGVAAKAGDKMLGAIQPSADKLADKIGGAAESLDRKGQAAMSKVGLAIKPPQAPAKPVTQGVKAGAPVMLSQPHDVHGNGRQLIPQGTQGKYIGPHSEPGHAVVEISGIQHVIPTKSLTYSAQHTDHKAIEKSKSEAAEQKQKQAQLTARQRAESAPVGMENAKRKSLNVGAHELQKGDIIHHGTTGAHAYGKVLEVSPDGKKVTLEEALQSTGSPDGIATTGRRLTIDGQEKLEGSGAVATRMFPVLRQPDEAKPIADRKEYQEMLAGVKKLGLNDDAAHEMAMQMWDESQARLNPKPKSAPAQVQNAPVQPAAQAAVQPKPRHHVSSLQAGDTIRLLSGPESQVNLRYLGPGSRKGFVTVEHPQRGEQEIPVKSAGLRVPGQAKAAKPEQVAAPQEQGSNPDRPRNHVSNLQKGDVLRHLSGDQKGQNVRFVRRSDKPGQVIVNTPERGDHELLATSLGLYSPASLSWYTKAHARNILEQNESMEPRDAIRLARLARGNRRAPQPHQVPRSEFAQYRHGMLAKDKQGNGFLLYGGNRYPLTSAEFDGNKLISDPVKIRERIHLEQIKAIASKDPAAVPSRVRAEYEHQWAKFTGSSAFAKSGGVQPQRSSRKNQPNAGQLNLLPVPSILQPSMEAGRRAQKIINARGVEDEREIDTEIDPNRPQAQIDRREAANRAFMEASASKFNHAQAARPVPGGQVHPRVLQQGEQIKDPRVLQQGEQIKSPALNQPAVAPEASPQPAPPVASVTAPPAAPSPAQEQKTLLWQLTRPHKMGRNEVNVQFDSIKQRDLHDYAASVANARSFSGKAGRGRPSGVQQQQAKLKAIADAHFGGNMDAAHQEALQVRAHVRAHMAGSQDGENRVIPPLGVEPAKPEPAPAAAPKQKLDTSIKKAITEARNSDAGGKYRVEHEILRSLPFDASEFDPEVLPQIVQMVKDHIGEFHAPKRMEAEKLASAWSNARARMGIPSDKRKSEARKLIQLMRNGEIDASSKKLKNMDLIAEGLRNDFPNHFSKDPQVRDSQVIDFLASNAPAIPQAHDWDLVKDFWKSLEPGYIEGLRAIAQGAPFNRSEWGNLARHMAPPDDYGDARNTQDFSASGHSFTQRFSAVWSAGVTREKIKDSAAATATSAGIPSRQVQA